MTRRLLSFALLSSFALAGFVAAPAVAGAANKQDVAIADDAVLSIDDLGAGWTEGAADDDDSSQDEIEALAKKISSCRQYVAFAKLADDSGVAKGDSPEFDQGDSTLESDVSIFTSAAKAKAAMAAFTSKSNGTCLAALFPKLLAGQGVTAKNAKFEVTPKLDDYGDQAGAIDGSFDVTGDDGTSITVYVGYAASRADRGVTAISYFLTDEALGEELPDLLTTAADKLDAALAG